MAVTLQLRTHKLKIRSWSIILLIFCLVGIYLLLPQVGELRNSLVLLGHANPWLIGCAVLLTAGDIALSAYTQKVAASGRGAYSAVLKRELAGSFLNHFLPYSVGIVTLVEEYYRKITRDRLSAYFIAIMPVLANFAISIAALLLVSPLTAAYIGARLHSQLPLRAVPVGFVAALCLLIAAIVYRHRITTAVHVATETIRSTRLRTICTVLGLVFVQIIMNTATLWAIAVSLDLPMSPLSAFVLILASNFTGNAAPTPGGIAVAEATLVIGITSIGLSLPDAVAITLLFRLVTFWLELIPGGWAIARLRHT